MNSNIKKENIYYIGEQLENQKIGGVKARGDIEVILRKRYPVYHNIKLASPSSFLKKIKFILDKNTICSIYKFLKINSNKYFIIQYPFPYHKVINFFLKKFCNRNKVIFFVHDIPSIQFGKQDRIDKEMKFLSKSDYLIIHNKNMEELLLNYGVKSNYIKLDLFDYLLPKIPKTNSYYGYDIVFAGNLKKSLFLEKIPTHLTKVQYILYGIGVTKQMKKNKNIHYKGSYPVDEIPYKLNGSFGLIWDGASIDTCQGPFGQYEKYNNPHKLSLYISCGMPVVVWSSAAVASFVKKYNIGITIDNFAQIEPMISQMSSTEYDEMKRNILILQKKIISGYYTNKSLDMLEKKITYLYDKE